MDDTAFLIEAHYLDLISKELGLNGDKRIDIKNLAINMAKENNLWCKEVFFYTCSPFQSSKPTADESISLSYYLANACDSKVLLTEPLLKQATFSS